MNTPPVRAPIDAGSRVSPAALVRAAASRDVPASACVGMALFAATGPAFAWLVQNFVDLGFVKKDPERAVAGAARCAAAVPAARRRRLHRRAIFPATSSRQIIKAMRARPVPAVPEFPARYYDHAIHSGTMLSRLTFNIEQVAEATTNSTGALIRDSLTIVLQIGWLIRAQLEAGVVRR